MEDKILKAQYRSFYMPDIYLEETRKFIDTIGPEKLINVMSLKPDGQADQIIVWYWEEE